MSGQLSFDLIKRDQVQKLEKTIKRSMKRTDSQPLLYLSSPFLLLLTLLSHLQLQIFPSSNLELQSQDRRDHESDNFRSIIIGNYNWMKNDFCFSVANINGDFEFAAKKSRFWIQPSFEILLPSSPCLED